MSGSRTTLAGRLARMGFADAARAERLLLTDLGGTAEDLTTDAVLTALAAAADPDLALTGLARVFGASKDRLELRQALHDEPAERSRQTGAPVRVAP